MSSSNPTRWSLVLGAAAGETDRREAFARRYAPVLRNYYAARWRLAREHDRVVDAVQDAFVQLFKDDGALQRVDPDRSGGFRAYLYGLASNIAAMNERRRRQRQRGGKDGDVEVEALESPDASASRTFDRSFATMLAREARRRMAETAASGDEKDAIRFRCLEARFTGGKSPRDIATELDRPTAEIYERLREARTRFRAALIEVVAEHNPGASRAEVEDSCRELAALL